VIVKPEPPTEPTRTTTTPKSQVKVIEQPSTTNGVFAKDCVIFSRVVNDEDVIMTSVIEVNNDGSLGKNSFPKSFVDNRDKKTVRTWCRAHERAFKIAKMFNVTESFKLWMKLSPVNGKYDLCRRLKFEKKNCQ